MSGLKVLGLIPARGGSKGLPGKNILEVGGFPLLAWTVIAAQKSRYIDRLILSSDDNEIISVARDYGCDVPFTRPTELAGDETSSADVARHAINNLQDKYDVLVLLQPTSPLRTTSDIDACVKLLFDTNAPSVISVCQTDKSPYWMFLRDSDGVLEPVIQQESVPSRRQDAPAVYLPNGAVYAVKITRFLENPVFIFPQSLGYVMPRNRSLDIDELDDFQWLAWQCEKNPDILPKMEK
jgi:CMP-N,N'-diacetyllegionaminic acid synthase